MRIVIGVLVGGLVSCIVACVPSRERGGGSGDDDGSGSGSDDPPVTATLALSPPASELVIENGAPAHASYTATLTYRDGRTRDVTAQTAFTTDTPLLDVSLLQLTGNQLTIAVATRLKVLAVYADDEVKATASANVTARVKSVRVDGRLPSTIGDLFEPAGVPALAPQIVYPPAGAILPRNLGDFEIHWTDAHGSDAFEVSLRTELSDVRVYVPGGNGDAVFGTTPSWAGFTAAEWTGAVGLASAVSYQVRGAKLAAPGLVGAMPAVELAVSNEPMQGGLYYWASTSTTGAFGIFRHDMSEPGTAAEPFITTAQTGGRCVGCHVLSRDGKQMAITYQDSPSPPGPATMVDVPTATIKPQTQRWNFATFTPDGKQLLSVDHGALVVRDAETQAVLATMTTTPDKAWVTHPDLSPDGSQLLYVRPATPGTDFSFKLGQIYARSYDAATHQFGPERVLLADGQNNFFPSWSPDGKWIAFNKCDAASASYDCSSNSAWVMKADGSQPTPLARANRGTGVTNSAIHWAPFAQTLGAGEPMFWLTISSKRDFGVRLNNETLVAQQARRAQLWMTPFFPARALAAQDPSAPAFRLPFQSLDTSNQTAQWTARVVDVIQ